LKVTEERDHELERKLNKEFPTWRTDRRDEAKINSSALPVGVNNTTTTLGNNLAIPNKVKQNYQVT
jgi:hypothetical protein